HITILCSYFLPGKMIRRRLKNAAKRGVKIKVITAGPSDVLMSKYAERWMYDWLLRNKIELYEYQPTVLHAKVAVCDSEWLTIGSYNINNISAYASIELNLDVRNAHFALAAEQKLEAIIKNDCIAITKEIHSSSTNIFKQFIRWCSYEIIRLMLYLFTFYFKQKDATKKPKK
ncbi:MAG TPA: phospholipase D-like domain-containing protein, partial [Ferruginibacter sp.]|nr:phospholipase D-like domain-containing protein [Ferruginibacter sp.]